jgi:hypothetical protein
MLFRKTVAVYCENRTEHTDTVRTSQETHASATETNRLMLFRKTVADYCENHTEHRNTLCTQNSEFWYAKAAVHIVTTGLRRQISKSISVAGRGSP